jgi:fungal STAND N-terminal Goodbye domain
MSSATDPAAPSNLQSILAAALEKYTAQTGKDLQNDPLTAEIRRCESSDDILHVFQAKAREFDEFRDDNSKLVKYLNPIVDCLDALSNNAALSAGVSLVSLSLLHHWISNLIDYPLGISTRTNNILRD